MRVRDFLTGHSVRLRLGIHVLVIAGLIFALIAAGFAEDYFTRGVAASNDLQPIPYTAGNPMAVNTFFDLEVDPAVVERSMDMIDDAGFAYIRQIFGWFDIEPDQKGVFVDRFGNATWTKFDHIVELANERNIDVIARLEKPPRWARANQPDLEHFPDGPPDRITDWIDYIAAVATRYKGQIHYYQIWNEPNLTGEWGGQPIDPRQYVDLLQAAYETIKGIDPDAVVLLAGLAPTDQTGPENLSDLLFLQRVYDVGGKDYFDIAAAMVYGYGYSPYDRRVDFERNNFSRPIQSREIMVKNGDASKPIWAVEYGWVSLPKDWGGNPSPWGDPVSAETQGRYLVEGYLRAQKEWPWMGVMAVWAFRWVQPPDDPDQIANPTRGFALVQTDFTPRPAYDALRSAGPAIKRSGTGAYKLTSTQQEQLKKGKQLILQIRGERVDLTLDAGSGGYVDVSVDGSLPRSYQFASGGTQHLNIASELPDSSHNIVISLFSEPSEHPPVLTRFTISRHPLQSWIYPWLEGLLLAILALNILSLGCAIVDWRRRRVLSQRWIWNHSSTT